MKLPDKRIKVCPICGSAPELKITDMGRPNGRGYPGRFWYSLACPHCGLPKEASSETVYHTAEEAHVQVIEHWNAEVDRIQEFINHRDE